MTIRVRLLTAAAVLALPAAMAGAQVTPPPAASPPATGTPTNPAPQTTPPPVTEDEATRAESPAQQAQDAADTTAEQAADAVEADAEAQAQTQTQTPPTPPAQSQVPAPTQAQTTQTPPTPPAEGQVPAQAEAQTSAQAGATGPAAAADIRAGVMVHDQAGGMVGTIESADATGAVVSTGTVRAKLPLASFGRNNQGLVIALTKAQLEAAVAAQGGTPPPTPSG